MENQPWAEKAEKLKKLIDDVEQRDGGSWSKREDFEMCVNVRHVNTWDDLQALLNNQFCDKRWVFRGHSKSKWRLETYLERAVLRHRKASPGEPTSESYIVSHPNKLEPYLLEKVQRQLHHYMSDLPSETQVLEWFALMQHYGIPTRLLDCTASPYVALFFAVEESRLNEECAVWAIDTEWVCEKAHMALSADDPGFPMNCDPLEFNLYLNRTLLKQVRPAGCPNTSPSIVVVADPIRANERTVAQQGVFLCDLGNVETFDITLLRMFHEVPADPPICKLVINTADRVRFINELTRMNIHSASLFPGFDGFARSIRLQLQTKVDEAYQRVPLELSEPSSR